MDNDTTRIELTKSEAAVLQAASRFVAAEIAAGGVTSDSEEAVLDRAADLAIRLAQKVDRKVSADEEVKSHLGGGSAYRPLG